MLMAICLRLLNVIILRPHTEEEFLRFKGNGKIITVASQKDYPHNRYQNPIVNSSLGRLLYSIH